MQILMRGTICRTEYSCGHRAGCPHSGPPPNAAFSCALIILTRWQRATRRRTRRREQSQSLAESSLQTSWHRQKATVRRNETSLQCASNSRHGRSADVKSLKESSVKASKHPNLISGSVSSGLERLTVGPCSLCAYCGHLTWYSPNG